MPVTIIGPKDRSPLPDGAIFINTTSQSKDWGRGFSPFILGPCELYGGQIAQNVENAWQFAKVYKCHTDSNGNPTEEYWQWAKAGWNSHRAERYPMGKGTIPEYTWWDGEKLSYIEARKKVYAPLYYTAVLNTVVYNKLRDLYCNGANIFLWDFDGYDNEKKGMSLEDVLNCPTMTMGHSFVLAAMLRKGI